MSSSLHYEKAKAYLCKHLSAQGLHGMLSLRDNFSSFDTDGSGSLSYEEFAAALGGYKLTNQEIRSLFVWFDKDGSNSIDYKEFVLGLRGQLSPQRQSVISDVFDRIDEDYDGVISCSDIGKWFIPAKHPLVVSGTRSLSDVLKSFMATFKGVGTDGAISKVDFQEYWADTTTFTTDDFFFNLMKSIWKSGGAPVALAGSLGAAFAAQGEGAGGKVVVKTLGSSQALPNAARTLSGERDQEQRAPVAFARAKELLRKKVAGSGPRGVLNLRDYFDEMDVDKSGTLSYEEFNAVLQSYKLTNQEIRALFVGFDRDGNGSLDYIEFCDGIRGELSPERKSLISDVFDGIDADCLGVITCEQIGKNFIASNHPMATDGKMSVSQVLKTFVNTFADVAKDGAISKESFITYWANVSSFTPDEEFFPMMRAIWKRAATKKSSYSGSLGEMVSNREVEERVKPKVVAPVKIPANVMAVGAIVASLKEELAKRGARGFCGISRKFKIMDDDGSKTLSKEEFKKGMRECSLNLSFKELDMLFEYFDQDKSGTINFEEFLQGLRNPLNERRLKFINLAFDIIDTDGSDIVEVHEIVRAYDASKHPDVIAKKKTADQVLREFLETFEVGETVDGMVTRQEFTNYYHNLSASIDSDDYWELMMRNAWHISGGEGWCANSSNLRVLATMEDGSQQVVEVKKDLGLDKTNKDDVISRLKKQGLSSVKGFSTNGAVEDDDKNKNKSVPLSELASRPKLKPKSLSEMPMKERKVEEEKKEEGPRKPQSLLDRMDGKTIKDSDSASMFQVTSKVSIANAAPQTKPKENGYSNVPSAGLTSIILKLKEQLKAHGAHGFVGLSRKFKIMDDDGSNTISLGEFKKGMKELKMDIQERELQLLFEFFDKDNSKSIDFNEFINGVREPMNARRLNLVHIAFNIIDKDGSGIVEPKEIVSCYDASKHPEVIAGKKTADQVLREFLATFDVGGVVDGMVTRQEFENYYHNISASIDRDDYFELMMRNAWHISGGEGAAANSANKRVLVTDSKGRQSVVEIKNDLGIKADDKDEMIRRLRAQGVDVAGLDFKGGVDEDEKKGGAVLGDALGPTYKPAPNRKLSSAAPGVLPGTGRPVASSIATSSHRQKFLTPATDSRPPVGVDAMILEMKELMSRRGAKGIVGLGRKFRAMDDDGNKSLDIGEFAKGLQEIGVSFSGPDVRRLFDYFDNDRSGTVQFEEFVTALRDPLNKRRRDLVLLAFAKIDTDGSGVMEPRELLEKYDASMHPDVLAGLKTKEQVLKEFVAVFEVGGTVDGMVTQQEFLNYYENLGVNIDDDDYFELMIRNAWHISGGEGWCENSSNLRVLATMSDGSQRVIEMQDDLGLKSTDLISIKKKLKAQGHNVVSVDTKGTVEEDKDDAAKSKSFRNSNLSLGAIAKTKAAQVLPSDLPVAKGKSGKSAFGEVKGSTVMDSLKYTGAQPSATATKAPAGEADHGVQMILNSVKSEIKRRGGSGMIGLSRKFKIIDDSGDGQLNFAEFKKSMKEMNFDLNDRDLHALFTHFDSDGSGGISYEEFIQGVRDPLNDRRKSLIKMAFTQIDKDGSGVIEAHEVAAAYDASKHPEVISGRKTADQVLREFLGTFDVGGTVDGCVTLEEFTNYYHNISASIFNEDYFELMMRNAWHISGGSGAAANSANKRVLVTDSQGRQSVVEIKSDLGIKADDKAEMMRRLKAQGVDVAGLDIKGAVEDEDALDPSKGASQGGGAARANFVKGRGNKTASQITFSGGNPEDDTDYRKAMGLSQRMKNSAVGKRDARMSSLGSGLMEKTENERIDYEPTGVKGSGLKKGTVSLEMLSKKSNVEDILTNLRNELNKRGARGISGIARKFRIIDDDNSKTIDPAEFTKAMRECNLDLSAEELNDLFKHFDTDGNGNIGYDEFLEGVRGPINDFRKVLILMAFDVMDKDGNGVLEPADVISCYDASKHPEVLAGKKTPDQVLKEFLDTFDVGGEKDGMVTKNEFLNYYKNISASIDLDDYFELMIRNAWHISGGKGWSANSANTRVFVTLKDGTEKVVEIANDLGLKAGDKTEAMRRLRRMGLDPAAVSFFDGVENMDKQPKVEKGNNWRTTLQLG